MKNPNGTNHVVHKKKPMAYSVEYLSSRKYRIQYTCVKINITTEPMNSIVCTSINGYLLSNLEYAICEKPPTRHAVNGMPSTKNKSTCIHTVALIAFWRNFFAKRVYSSTISAR